MNYKDAQKWLKLGFKVRRKKWPTRITCLFIEEKDGKEHMKLNKPTVPFQTVTRTERNATDWERE